MSAVTPSDLARRFFLILGAKDRVLLQTFVHEEVVFVPMMFPDRRYEGRDAVLKGFFEIVYGLPAYRPEAVRFTDLDESMSLVEGRVHYVDAKGVVRDSSACWLLAFEDGKLRSLEGKGSRLAALELYEERRTDYPPA